MAKGSVNGKDPAVSWYWNDWGGGTRTLTRHQKGCYMDLLEAQFNNGGLSLDEIKTVLGSDFGSTWPALQKKFEVGEDGIYRNIRLLNETLKRKSFNQSRRENYSYDERMGIGKGNDIDNRKKEFKESVSEIGKNIAPELLKEFCDYWTEHSKSGRKMRFEKEKVFDISRRLGTWQAKAEEFSKFKPGVKSGYPDYYSPDFVKKLQPSELPAYWNHLRSKGLVPIKGRTGETLDWQKPLQAS